MENERSKKLLEKYLAGQCTAKEKAIVETWYLRETDQLPADIEEPDYEKLEKEIWSNIHKLHPEKTNSGTKKFWYAAAAILVLCGSLYTGAYLSGAFLPDSQYEAVKNDIQPGKNKAILTLSNGHKISLDDALNGEIAKQSGCRISKTAAGQLIYTLESESQATTTGLNSIETPRGGQYQVNLPDGTKVWLNAASSLTYPAAFTGQQRQVQLKGEAYFEVAKNKQMPFIVSSEKQKIEVLGTHFNVNAYADGEPVRTTLAEGSVRISLTQNPAEQGLLKPGQQSVAGAHLKIVPVEVEEFLAWKEGLFMFNNENLGSIMKKVERWYDVQINFQEPVLAERRFSGSVSRFSQVSQLLKTLELTGSVHFKIEGRKIIVTK